MTALQYLLYPPKGESQSTYPLVIFLHGIGERGNDVNLIKKWGLPRFTESSEVALPAYIAAPQCPADELWVNLVDELDATLDDLLGTLPVDPDAVLLTGFSMGGFGTWAWGSQYPERFAALLPVGGSAPIDPAALERLKTKPIWMVHSAKDQSVPVRWADEVAVSLLNLGADFGYTRYPDASHGGTSDRAFCDMTILNWLLAQRRGATE